MRLGSARSLDAGVTASTVTGHLPSSYQDQGLPTDQILFGPGQINIANRAYDGNLRHAYQSSTAMPTEQQDLFQEPNATLHTQFGRARFIGAFMRKYLLFEEGTSLFYVDQHAAQERIMFEKFQKQIDEGSIEIQPLLTPILIKLNVREKIALEEIQSKLDSVGIETGLFDEETLAIQTQPVLLKNLEPAVRVLLSGEDIARCDRNTLARRACKASIVTGDILSPAQANYQREQLLVCKDPFTCPHGRPTVVEIKESFLDRHFLRT